MRRMTKIDRINKNKFFRVEYQFCWKPAWCAFQKPCPCHLQLNFARSGKVGDCLIIENNTIQAARLAIVTIMVHKTMLMLTTWPRWSRDTKDKKSFILIHLTTTVTMIFVIITMKFEKILSIGRHPTSSLWWTRLPFQSIHQSYKRCDNTIQSGILTIMFQFSSFLIFEFYWL